MRILSKDEWRNVGDAGIFCFGGGKGLKTLAKNLKEIGWLDRVEAVVDNKASLWGSTISLAGKEWPVISPQQLRENITTQCIVISCVAREEIQKQLAAYPELKGKRVAYYGDIVDGWFWEKVRHMKFPDGIRNTKEPIIPKIIHYCWFGGGPIPAELQQYINTWQRMCPDYEIKRWDESNYDVGKNRYMKDAYDAKKWGFVPDYARLDIIYEHGGFYLDTDVELRKSLDEFRYNEAFMGMEPGGRVNPGLGFGAVQHHPMLKELRDDYENYTFVDFHTKWEAEREIKVSPDLQTMELEAYGFQRDCFQEQDIRGIHIYPLPIFGAAFKEWRCITEETYAVHHYVGTWVPKE